MNSYSVLIFKGSKQDFMMSSSTSSADVTIAPGQTYEQTGQNGYTMSGGLDTGDNRCQIVISGSARANANRCQPVQHSVATNGTRTSGLEPELGIASEGDRPLPCATYGMLE